MGGSVVSVLTATGFFTSRVSALLASKLPPYLRGQHVNIESPIRSGFAGKRDPFDVHGGLYSLRKG